MDQYFYSYEIQVWYVYGKIMVLKSLIPIKQNDLKWHFNSLVTKVD
jgi:hypothetical protein